MSRRAPEAAGELVSRDLRRRFWLLVAFFALWCMVIAGRLYHLQIVEHEIYEQRAQRQQQRKVQFHGPRGVIYDSQGRQLAVSVQVDSAWADPSKIDDAEAFVAALEPLIEIDRKRLVESLSSDREFVWVARKLEPEQSEALRRLELSGLGFYQEPKRYYPMDALASQILGYVGTDNQGLAGLESAYDALVTGERVDWVVVRDRLGNILSPAANLIPSAGGDLVLTLDARLQFLAERELESAVLAAKAKGGTVVLLDPRDSAVLAMASFPTFDPNRWREAKPDHWRNRAVMDAFEPGSTFKMVTAAAALDAAIVHPDDPIDCERGGWSIHNTYIRDHASFDRLTFREVIEQSSNVGVMKVAQRLGSARLYQVARHFGLGKPTEVDLPGESAGILRPLEAWDELTNLYASFGHGLSVTPLQLANAYAALVNGGHLNRPYVVAEVRRASGTSSVRPVGELQSIEVSPATRNTLIHLLEGVVDRGTGRNAQLRGYRIGGKTGTAQKSSREGYSATGRVASFVAFGPSRRPRLVCLVVIDEPRTSVYGSEVAAPAVAAILSEALTYLGVPPDRDRWPEQTAWIPWDSVSADFRVAHLGERASTENRADRDQSSKGSG